MIDIDREKAGLGVGRPGGERRFEKRVERQAIGKPRQGIDAGGSHGLGLLNLQQADAECRSRQQQTKEENGGGQDDDGPARQRVGGQHGGVRRLAEQDQRCSRTRYGADDQGQAGERPDSTGT